MPRLVNCTTIDRPDGRFGVIATIEPDRTYHQEGFLSLAEAQEWVEGLRVVMSAIGAPVAHTSEEAPLAEADGILDLGSYERPPSMPCWSDRSQRN